MQPKAPHRQGRSGPVNLALVDKSPIVLAGLKSLVLQDGRFNLVATACDGERFLDAVRRFHFEVAVIGWEMPYMDGRAVLEALRGLPSAPRIVVYTGSSDPSIPRQVLTLGGAAFVSKREPPERLLSTIRAVAEGRMVFPFLDVRRLDHDPLSSLSGREREILEALGTGKTNAQLARAFGLSVNTVKFHLRHLFDKLAVRNRAQAVQVWHQSRHGPALSGGEQPYPQDFARPPESA